MQKFDKEHLPKGYKGAVDRYGTFYQFESCKVLLPCHDRNFRALTLQELQKDPRILFESVKEKLEHPEFYAVNYQDYDFKALSIDFLGLCSFTIYGDQIGNYAAIEVPDPKIYGYAITKEQQETLCELVRINQCSLESLRPIFRTRTDDLPIPVKRKI